MSGLTDAGNFDAYGQPVVTLWTSATTAGPLGTGTGVIVTTAGLDTIALTFSTPAGISGGVVSFYAFDGANYIPIKCPYISNYSTASSLTLSASQTVGFTVPIAGYPAFQYVLTTAITGTGNVTITTISSSAPDVSIVSAGIDPMSNLPNVTANSNTNGMSTLRYFTANNTTPQAIKSTSGRVHAIRAINNAASSRYLKFYNIVSGSVTVGTSSVAWTFLLPATSTTVFPQDLLGMNFLTAISCTVTTGFLDNDNTAPSANDCLIQVDYV